MASQLSMQCPTTSFLEVGVHKFVAFVNVSPCFERTHLASQLTYHLGSVSHSCHLPVKAAATSGLYTAATCALAPLFPPPLSVAREPYDAAPEHAPITL